MNSNMTIGLKLRSIWRLLKCKEFVLFADQYAGAACTSKYIEVYVPFIYQELTDIDLGHRGKQITTKARTKKGDKK